MKVPLTDVRLADFPKKKAPLGALPGGAYS